MLERVLEAELDAAFPEGWFALALSEELKPAGVLARRAFGRDLVLWRTADGEAHCANAECPHYAAHMGHRGTVVDDGLVCPIHGLRFDRAGLCMARHPGKPAPNYSIRMYPTAEIDGLIHVWRDLACREPPRGPDDAGRALRRWTINLASESLNERAVEICRLMMVHTAIDVQFFLTPVELAVTDITVFVSGVAEPDVVASFLERLENALHAAQPH